MCDICFCVNLCLLCSDRRFEYSHMLWWKFYCAEGWRFEGCMAIFYICSALDRRRFCRPGASDRVQRHLNVGLDVVGRIAYEGDMWMPGYMSFLYYPTHHLSTIEKAFQ